MQKTIRVSAQSRPTAVAGALAGMVREGHEIEMRAIGAGAVSQAIKAVAAARVFLEMDGLDIWIQPRMELLQIDGVARSAVLFAVCRVRANVE